MSQEEVYKHIHTTYKGYIHKQMDKYVVINKESIPKPMLCVHLDTINTHYVGETDITPNDFELDEVSNVIGLSSLSQLSCLGGDDRAGVYIALKLLDYMIEYDDWKYSIGFFKDEELGCIGSSYYKDDLDTTCYIGLDRRSFKGRYEVALYDYDNVALTTKFTELGYIECKGSITDSAELAGSVACINLSVGYDKEHTKNEVLYLDCMEYTYNVLKEMVYDDTVYIPEESYWNLDDNSIGFDYLDTKDGEDYSQQEMYYMYQLEEENTILKSRLKEFGVDVDELLKEEMYLYS